MEKKLNKKLAIYQTKDWAIELHQDFDNETFWANQKQIAEIFCVERSVVTKHIKNIYKDNEVDKKLTCANFAQVQKEWKRQVKRNVEIYNLDIILAIWYRINSAKAIQFRKRATKILKQHITKGYTINEKILDKNHKEFLKAVEDIKILTKYNQKIKNDDILELIKTFSSTWFSLESYDKQNFPKEWKIANKTKIDFEELSENLYKEIKILKNNLISKNEATDFFAQEKSKESLKWIVGNVFQSAFWNDVYKTIEEKSAHLLYFIVKDHPFVDGNKRTWAFAFILFLQKVKYNFENKIIPETLTTLTLLIAESDPKDKEKMIWLILLLLKK